MNKQEVLSEITELSKAKAVTKEEVLGAFYDGTKTDSALFKQLNVAEILYYLGGAVVFIGIAIFVSQNWEILDPLARVLVTLGSGILAYYIGALLNQKKIYESVGLAFFLISALVTPVGLVVLLDSAGVTLGGYGIQTIVAAVLVALYGVSYILFRKSLFIVFTIIFSTWLFFAVTGYITQGVLVDTDTFWVYKLLLTGVSYMLLGYYFAQSDKAPLSGPLNGFGIFFFLTSALYLSGWGTNGSAFWELLFPFLTFAAIFTSTHIKSKTYLVFGTLYLIIYLFKITSEYFSQSLGWPFALVLAGLGMIAIGYYSFYLNKRYLKS